MLTHLHNKNISADLYDSYGRTPIALLFAKQHFKFTSDTEYLIEENWVDVNTPTFYNGKHVTLLELAIRFSDVKDIQYLVEKTNAEFTYAALKMACTHRNERVFQYLFRMNAKALEYAARKGYTNLLENILKELNQPEVEVEEVDEEVTIEIEVDSDITSEEADAFIEAQTYDENARTIRLVRRNGVVTAIISSRQN